MVIILILTLSLMIISIIFAKTLNVFQFNFSLYWIVSVIGSLILFLFDQRLALSFFNLLFENNSINPLKIIVLFLSLTAISIYLDEIGLIAYLASKTASIAGTNQKKLFFYFYLLVSFLTIFTANDIVILTMTPFIIYLSKASKINPIPFVVMLFVAANTWSMLLIIGNPTNIYIATSFGINFINYFNVMFFPTLFAGVTSYWILRILFHQSLNQTMIFQEQTKTPNPLLSFLGLFHLIGATLMMAFSSYLGLEMFVIALIFSVSLFLSHLVVSLFGRRQKSHYLKQTLIRLPWSLIPFFLSMVFLINAIDNAGWVTWLGHSILGTQQNWIYGVSAFFIANLINNIPMSILFSNMLSNSSSSVSFHAIYASIIGSNIAAIFTPIGALAGMMWMSILKRLKIKMNFYDFLRFGIVIGLPILFVSLFILEWVV